MLKIAEISQVDFEKGLVKVRIPDRDNIESNWLAMSSFEYEMPKVNDYVRVDLDDNDYKTGICHGRYFNQKNLPTLHGENIYYKELLGDLVLQYDSDSKTLEITAQNILIKGNVSIDGSLFVSGDISATGSIIDTGGNTNHHTH